MDLDFLSLPADPIELNISLAVADAISWQLQLRLLCFT